MTAKVVATAFSWVISRYRKKPTAFTAPAISTSFHENTPVAFAEVSVPIKYGTRVTGIDIACTINPISHGGAPEDLPNIGHTAQQVAMKRQDKNNPSDMALSLVGFRKIPQSVRTLVS
jgi:hypothetical protein